MCEVSQTAVSHGLNVNCDEQTVLRLTGTRIPKGWRHPETPISLKYLECADEEVETTPIIHAQTVWTVEVGQTSDAALHRMCLISKLFFASAIWVLPDCKKGKALSMLEYTAYVLMFVHALMFAISLHQCPEFEEQRRSRIFYVGFSACISNCWPTRMRSCYRWFVCLVNSEKKRA